MSITAERIVKLFEEDERARKKLAELLVTEPDIRLTIINAVIRDVATKGDLEELKKEFKAEVERVRIELKGDISKLEGKVDDLTSRVVKVESQLSLLIKVFFAINISILLGIIGLLIRGLVP